MNHIFGMSLRVRIVIFLVGPAACLAAFLIHGRAQAVAVPN